MMTALALRPMRLAGALLAATLLASCGGGEPAKPQSDFKPVPVSPLLGDAPLGAETAPVTMIEYASLACTHCRDFSKQVMPRLQREYIETGKLKYIYRDMSIHPQGFDITLAALTRCKGEATYHELLDDFFAHFADITEAAQKGEAATILSTLTAKHGMSWDEARTCIDYTPELKAAIEKTGAQGEQEAKAQDPKLQGRKTPTVFVNGKYLGDKISYEDVKAAIDGALSGAPAAEPAAPATPPAQ